MPFHGGINRVIFLSPLDANKLRMRYSPDATQRARLRTLFADSCDIRRAENNVRTRERVD